MFASASGLEKVFVLYDYELRGASNYFRFHLDWLQECKVTLH